MTPQQKKVLSTYFPDIAIPGDRGVDGMSIKGDKGDKGDIGNTGERGMQGIQGIPGRDGIDGTNGKDGRNGLDGRDGKDGRDGRNGKDAVITDEILKPFTEKLEKLSTTLSPKGKIDQRWHGGGLSRVSHDSTLSGSGTPSDPLFVVAGSSSGFQLPLTGALTGTNTWTTAPNAIAVDGLVLQKVQQDGTVNWTGTTTTVLTVAPNFSVCAIA